MTNIDKEDMHRTVKRHQIEESLRGECLSTIEDRVSRYLELNFIEIIPNEQPFAPVSTECIRLYRDGYFFACIALCQAVAEALVRFICEKSKFGASLSRDFEKNVEKLYERKIKPDCSQLLKEIWKGRDDYHHLNPKVPTERAELQTISKSKIITLHKVESEVFEFEYVGGAIKPKYPKYWPEAKDGLISVFLRFEP